MEDNWIFAWYTSNYWMKSNEIGWYTWYLYMYLPILEDGRQSIDVHLPGGKGFIPPLLVCLSLNGPKYP